LKKFELGQTVSMLANIGVIAGIIFLGLEIQQNTEMIRAQITQSRADAAIGLAQSHFNSEYIPEISEKISQGGELTGLETIRYESYLRAVFRNQENNFLQFQQGMLGENIPRNTQAVVRGILANDAVAAAWWNGMKVSFSDEFVEFVDDIVEH